MSDLKKCAFCGTVPSMLPAGFYRHGPGDCRLAGHFIKRHEFDQWNRVHTELRRSEQQQPEPVHPESESVLTMDASGEEVTVRRFLSTLAVFAFVIFVVVLSLSGGPTFRPLGR